MGLSATQRRAWKAAVAGILLLAAALYFVQLWVNQNEVLDDAYITFRFARNLAEGDGLRWNPGGPPTEGFTSMLHVLLLSVLSFLNLSLPRMDLVLLAVCLTAACVLLFHTLTVRLRVRWWITAVCIALFLADPNTAALTVSGLETDIFVLCLVTLYAVALHLADAPGYATGAAFAAVSFVTILCRPDGAIYVTGSAAVLLYWFRREHIRLTWLVFPLTAMVFAGLAYLGWNFAYFGYALPNPFYVKSAGVSSDGISFVSRYALHIVGRLGPLVAVVLILHWNSRTQLFKKSILLQPASLLALIPAIFALGYYLTIVHEVGGNHRFSYPTYVYFVIAVALLWNLAIPNEAALYRREWVMLPVALALMFLMPPLKGLSWPIQPAAQNGFNQYHFQIAHALEKTGLGPRLSVICDGAGIIPYVSRCRLIDRVGLVDNFLSGRHPMTYPQREAYLWAQNADVYIAYEPPAPSGSTSPDDDMKGCPSYVGALRRRRLLSIENRTFPPSPELQHQRMVVLRDQWEWVGELKWPTEAVRGLLSFAYVRRNSPHREELVDALRQIVKEDAAPPCSGMKGNEKTNSLGTSHVSSKRAG